MIEKVKLNEVLTALPVNSNSDFVVGRLTDGTAIQINKANFAKMMDGLLNIDGLRTDFDGNFSNFRQWTKGGVYRYFIHIYSPGVIDGPDGLDSAHGILEVFVRADANTQGLNIISQKFYNHLGMKMRVCLRKTASTVDNWDKGEWKTIYTI